MKRFVCVAALLVTVVIVGTRMGAQAPTTALPTPGFHHLHLNSVNPDAAIEFYTKAFPSTSKSTFAGQPALRSPNNVWFLFNKVDAPPATEPQTAFWHFGWHVTDVHKSRDMYVQRGLPLLPLYTEEAGGTVFTSADTWPGTGGALGLTKSGIADAKAKGVKPGGGAGFAYLRGPDDAITEYQGKVTAERFNHTHMLHGQPFCAQLWCQTNLNMASGGRGNQPQRTEANWRVARGADKPWPALTYDGMYR